MSHGALDLQPRLQPLNQRRSAVQDFSQARMAARQSRKLRTGQIDIL